MAAAAAVWPRNLQRGCFDALMKRSFGCNVYYGIYKSLLEKKKKQDKLKVLVRLASNSEITF